LVGTVLDEILAAHRKAAAEDDRRLDDIVAAAAAAPPARGFAAALRSGSSISVIAEVKRRSPSKGDLAPDLDPAATARAYETGGARALSVLTDARYFGGSADDLGRARAACSLPVLRKDFTVDLRDVADARAMGADAVLLIVAALDDTELASLASLARSLGIDALVEVHDSDELARALDAGAELIGVNQRDLRTFEVDTRLAEDLVARVPPEVVRVAESGIGGAADLARLSAAGYDAALVGEHLVTSGDPVAALRRLRGGQ